MLPFLQDKLWVPYYYGFYEENGIECLILEYIRGTTLDKVEIKNEAQLKKIAKEAIDLV